MNKVLVTIEGGVIQSVMSNDPDIKVLVIDTDTEGVPEEDILSDEMVQSIARSSEDMDDVEFKCYVSKKPIFE